VTWGRGEWRLIIFCDRLTPFLKSPSLPLSQSPKSLPIGLNRISWKLAVNLNFLNVV